MLGVTAQEMVDGVINVEPKHQEIDRSNLLN